MQPPVHDQVHGYVIGLPQTPWRFRDRDRQKCRCASHTCLPLALRHPPGTGLDAVRCCSYRERAAAEQAGRGRPGAEHGPVGAGKGDRNTDPGCTELEMALGGWAGPAWWRRP